MMPPVAMVSGLVMLLSIAPAGVRQSLRRQASHWAQSLAKKPSGSAGTATGAPGIGATPGTAATGAAGTPGAAHDARLIATAIPPAARAARNSLRMTNPPRNARPGPGAAAPPAATVCRFTLLCRCSSRAVLTDYAE